MNENFTWNQHIVSLKAKLSRAIGLLPKIRQYIPQKLNKIIYSAIFHSHLIYGCQIWGQVNHELTNSLKIFQDKALKIINFMKNDDNINPLYIKGRTLKFSDYIKYLNCLFLHDCLNNKLPDNFLHYFTLTRNVHNHNTREARNQKSRFQQKIQPPMESILS